jgi:hypothetical protein
MIPEPCDGSRIEFEYNGDVYAAWRDAASTARTGHDPEQTWRVHGHHRPAPMSWRELIDEYGEGAIAGAIVLLPTGVVSSDFPVGYSSGGFLKWLDVRNRLGIFSEG